jgi:DNA polymerase III delta subunit
MAHFDPTELIRQLLVGDPTDADNLVRRARTSTEPLVLVVAALSRPGEAELLVRALRLASTARDRQVIAIASAFLAGETDRVQALAREHLLDHPDSVLVAWLAASAPPSATAPRPIHPRPRHQEES